MRLAGNAYDTATDFVHVYNVQCQINIVVKDANAVSLYKGLIGLKANICSVYNNLPSICYLL